jgi:TolB-like protein
VLKTRHLESGGELGKSAVIILSLIVPVLISPYALFGQTQPTTKPATTATQTPPAKKARPLEIAIFPLEAKGIDKSVADMVTDTLHAQITRIPNSRVIGAKELDTMMGYEQKKQLSGCTDTSCIVAIAGAMGVAKLVVGSVGKLGSSYLFNVKLLDVHEGRVEAIFDKRLKGSSEEELLDTIPEALSALFPGNAALWVAGTHRGPQPAALRNWGIGLTVSGAGVVAMGGVMTYLAATAQDDMRNAKDSKGIVDAQSRLDAYNGAAIAMYSLGGAALATGIVLWALSAVDNKSAGAARAERGPTLRDMAFAPVFAPGFGGITVGGEW